MCNEQGRENPRGRAQRICSVASDEPGLERGLASFLARAYNLKTAADYAVGVDVAVSASEATDAIDGAARFVGAN